MNESKIGRYFTLRPETVTVIKQYSEENKLSQGEVIDELVNMYLGDGGSKNKLLAKTVADEFDLRHAEELSRLQSSVKFTDINVQTILQTFSTLLWWLPNGPRSGSLNGMHQVIRDAETSVKQKIADNKQRADNRKG